MSYTPPAGPPPAGTAPNNQLAVGSLIAGVVGAVLSLLCGIVFIAPVIAIVLGFVAKNQIKVSAGTQGGDGMATAGIILGFAGIAMGILWRVILFS